MRKLSSKLKSYEILNSFPNMRFLNKQKTNHLNSVAIGYLN